MSIAGRLVKVAAAAIAIIVLFPAAASACQIDNDSDVKLDIWFDCGIACGNYFRGVDPGTSVSRPNKAGHVEACKIGPPRLVEGRTGENPDASVGAHGQVGVTFKENRVEPILSEFTWVSKGGNSWKGSKSHLSLKLEDQQSCWRGTP